MSDPVCDQGCDRLRRGRNALRLAAFACMLLAEAQVGAQTARAPIPPSEPNAFELELVRTRFDHEVAFRAAAIHVAWGAETLCERKAEIEPFVLWSLHAARKSLSTRDEGFLKRATGMDDQWRVAWVDESAPDELKVGDVVLSINGEKLPGRSTSVSLSAVFSGQAMVSADDQPYWDVIQKARVQAASGKPMQLQLASGRVIEVSTQTGCAGSVHASAFDSDPDVFLRQGALRAKIPANALFEARTQDEFRWLAAFGTFFQANATAAGRQQEAEGLGTAFTVGKVLALALPGAGMLLSAAEAQAGRAIAVDGLVGRADLFATEVVVALGGDAQAGLRLARRIREQGVKADALVLGDFRLSSMAEHIQRLRDLQVAAEAAAAKAN